MAEGMVSRCFALNVKEKISELPGLTQPSPRWLRFSGRSVCSRLAKAH